MDKEINTIAQKETAKQYSRSSLWTRVLLCGALILGPGCQKNPLDHPEEISTLIPEITVGEHWLPDTIYFAIDPALPFDAQIRFHNVGEHYAQISTQDKAVEFDPNTIVRSTFINAEYWTIPIFEEDKPINIESQATMKSLSGGQVGAEIYKIFFLIAN